MRSLSFVICSIEINCCSIDENEQVRVNLKRKPLKEIKSCNTISAMYFAFETKVTRVVICNRSQIPKLFSRD